MPPERNYNGIGFFGVQNHRPDNYAQNTFQRPATYHEVQWVKRPPRVSSSEEQAVSRKQQQIVHAAHVNQHGKLNRLMPHPPRHWDRDKEIIMMSERQQQARELQERAGKVARGARSVGKIRPMYIGPTNGTQPTNASFKDHRTSKNIDFPLAPAFTERGQLNTAQGIYLRPVQSTALFNLSHRERTAPRHLNTFGNTTRTASLHQASNLVDPPHTHDPLDLKRFRRKDKSGKLF